MKGISAKIVTDEETVRMHTNFADVKNYNVQYASKELLSYSIQDGTVRVHTNTLSDWAYVSCDIPQKMLKVGQRYGISVKVNKHNIRQFNLQDKASVYFSTVLIPPYWDGDRVTSVVRYDKEVGLMGILAFFPESNTDYEFSDFRIWEIDDLGGAIVSILLIMLATSIRKEVAA